MRAKFINENNILKPKSNEELENVFNKTDPQKAFEKAIKMGVFAYS